MAPYDLWITCKPLPSYCDCADTDGLRAQNMSLLQRLVEWTPANFRPIAIISSLAKAPEKIISQLLELFKAHYSLRSVLKPVEQREHVSLL